VEEANIVMECGEEDLARRTSNLEFDKFDLGKTIVRVSSLQE
jgi:hypothetical protein